MIDYNGLRNTVAKGLSEYTGVKVVRSNQNAPQPEYDFIQYTITTLKSENNGTYGEYEDGIMRKGVTQTWSISALSDDSTKSVTLADKAHEWFSRVGKLYLNDNNVIVQSVGGITNRDNVLTVEYEYKNGFDVVFWLFDEIGGEKIDEGEIKIIDIGGNDIDMPPTVEELNEQLEKRLDGEVI